MFSNQGARLLTGLLLALTRIETVLAARFTVDPKTGGLVTLSLNTGFNTARNFEGWAASAVSDADVSSGLLSGISLTTEPRLSLVNIANKPDLDLAFNDYLDLRVRLPVNYGGELRLFYVCSNAPSTTAEQTVAIPNSVLAKDGGFHVYRLDFGLDVWWRGFLRDLVIQPVTVANAAFAVDYIRIGDQPNDVYLRNLADAADVGQYELSSKHFRFIWNAAVANSSLWDPVSTARGSLRNAEESWQVYVRMMGYREPAQSTNIALRDGKKYKVNFYCIYDGYFMSGSDRGFAFLNIHPSGLRVDPPTGVLPHELMHVFQGHNNDGGGFPWWENFADYGHQRVVQHYLPLGSDEYTFNVDYLRNAHFVMPIGRTEYINWLPYLYLDENPDNLSGLGEGTMLKLLQQTTTTKTYWQVLESLTPTSTLKDIFGRFARRGVSMNYKYKATFTNPIAAADPFYRSIVARYQFTELVQRTDLASTTPDSIWWRVPFEMAPQQGAYAIHPLVPNGAAGSTGRVVTVTFRVLPDPVRGADCRASFVIVADNGAERYTDPVSTSTLTVTLAPNENSLYLAVAGTPDRFIQHSHDEAVVPFRSHPSKARFPYELKVAGAVPRQSGAQADVAGLIRHANGGGFRASSTIVDATAYIAPGARVLESAQVRGNARIEDFAVVRGSAQVLNNAVVSGYAVVYENAIVRDQARVRDWALVHGSAILANNARVLERADVSGNQMLDTSVAKGNAAMWEGGGKVTGNAILDGDYAFNRNVRNGFVAGHLPWVGIPDNFITPVPAGQLAQYDFVSAHASLALDSIGVSNGYLVNSPKWIETDGVYRTQFLELNGVDQYIVLSSCVIDSFSFTFGAWLKPAASSVVGQVAFSFGAGGNRVSFTPRNALQKSELSVTLNDASASATGTALPARFWSHVAFAMNGATVTLYVNGSVVASVASTARADQFRGSSLANSTTAVYIGRGLAGSSLYAGSVDAVSFFSSALSASAIAVLGTAPRLLPRPPTKPQPLASSLMAYYPMVQDLFPSGPAVDFSGLGKNGTLIGVQRYVSSSVSFDGGNNFMITPIANGATRTLSAWVYPRSVTAGRIFDSDVQYQYGAGFGFANGKVDVILDNQLWPTNADIRANMWQHVLLTFNSTQARVFVNGTLKATLAYTQGSVTAANYVIGKSNANETPFYSGLLREVRIHSVAVTAAEAALIMNTDAPGSAGRAL